MHDAPVALGVLLHAGPNKGDRSSKLGLIGLTQGNAATLVWIGTEGTKLRLKACVFVGAHLGLPVGEHI